MKVQGSPGYYTDRSGKHPELGSGVHVDDYTPPTRFQSSGDMVVRGIENTQGTNALYGTPLTMASQQLLAYEHALQAQGFGDDPVTFTVNWAYHEPGLFTADQNGWICEQVEEK